MKANRPTNKLASLLFLSLIAINSQLAAVSYASDFAGSLKSVTITDSGGTNAAPTAVINFTQNDDIINFDASGSSDDGSISEYRWDFGDGSIGNGVTVTHQFATGTFPVTLTIVDNGGAVALAQENISFNPQFSIAVNFQPAASSIPTGYEGDSGGVFDSAKGYGWLNLPLNSTYFDYDLDISPDQAYDTVMVMPTADGIWELAVTNGDYSVTICMGDPKYPAGVVNSQTEGISVTTGRLSTETPWIEHTSIVNVSDGKLTVTFTGGGSRRRLNWINVLQLLN